MGSLRRSARARASGTRHPQIFPRLLVGRPYRGVGAVLAVEVEGHDGEVLVLFGPVAESQGVSQLVAGDEVEFRLAPALYTAAEEAALVQPRLFINPPGVGVSFAHAEVYLRSQIGVLGVHEPKATASVVRFNSIPVTNGHLPRLVLRRALFGRVLVDDNPVAVHIRSAELREVVAGVSVGVARPLSHGGAHR